MQMIYSWVMGEREESRLTPWFLTEAIGWTVKELVVETEKMGEE